MAAIDQLTALTNLIGGMKDKKSTTTTSGGKTTQQTNVSDAGVQQIIDQILSGSGGVKSIGARARSSGIYNSTSEDTLLGNLYAEAANRAELARSPTVTTTAPQTQTTVQQGTSAKDLATGLGGAFLASTALNLGAKALGPTLESGANYVTDLIGDLFGGGSGGGSSEGIFSNSGTKKNQLGDIDFGGYGDFGGPMPSGSTGITTGEGFGLNTSTISSGGGGGSTGQGGFGINFGIDSDTGSTSVGLGGLGGLGSIGGIIGSIVSGLGGSNNSGSRGGTSGGSVICTALKNRGLLDKDLHAKGSEYLETMHPFTVAGYQAWATGIAAKIDKGHEGWTKFTLPVARSRTSLLATRGTFADHVKYPLGTITKFIGEPVCHLIGLFITERAFDKLWNKKGA